VVPSSQRAALQLRSIFDLFVRARLDFCDGAVVPATRRPMLLTFRIVPPMVRLLAPTPPAPLPLRARSLAAQPPVLVKRLPQNTRAARELARVRWVLAPEIFCGAAGARASICACSACNTKDRIRAIRSRPCGTTTASHGSFVGIQ